MKFHNFFTLILYFCGKLKIYSVLNSLYLKHGSVFVKARIVLKK